ncbi:MAG: hypothetical protein E6Q83_12520 [Thiothrix sp.]|nr:MAG: hypothetical protein E6Q83_12520 [Thiothrix sp.]
MKIIKRNRPILFISQVLLASYLPTQFTTAQAAEATLTEAPPPWAARQELAPLLAESGIQEANNKLTEARADKLPQARTQATKTNSSSMEQWYAQRQAYAAPAQSAPELKTKSTQGDLNAQYALALQLRQDPSPENIAESLKLQEKAARGGHVEAQYGLGVLYSNGQYLPQDQRLANFWYAQAAKRGSEAAKLALSDLPTPTAVTAPVVRAARPSEAPRAASPEVAQATVIDNSENMFAASEPATGSDMPAMSAEEYAALEADANPSVEMLMSDPQASRPAPKPANRQVRQPQIAAAPQEAIAPEELVQPTEGAAGAEGAPELPITEAEAGDISVEHNESKVDLGNMSVQEIINTAQKGDMYAQLMLGALFEDGTDPAIPQDIKEAAKWYAKAAKQGYPKAQHNLALLYEDGRGVPQSYTEAAKWYAKAAKAGFSEAQNNLAVLYILGNGVKQDRAQAEKLLTAAVGQGNENARRNLQKLLEGAAS